MMRFTRAGRVSLAAAGGLAVALVAAACTSSGTGTSTTTASAHLEKTNVVVGSLPVVDSAGLFLAQQNGYFKQAGLNVTITPLKASTQAIPDMEKGTIDVVAGANYVSFLQAEEVKGLKFKVLVDGEACSDDTFQVLAMPNTGISGPAQLAHKKIAVNVPNNIQTLLTNTALETAGVNPSTVQYVQIPFPQMGAALASHQVDAISVVEPFITENELTIGAQPVMSTCTGPTANFPISGYLSTAAFTQKYPNTARAFQRALDRGQALADSSRSDVEEIMPNYIKGLSPNKAAVVNLGQFPTSLDATHLQRVASAMYAGHLVPTKFQVTPLLFR
jgi:NitT/TauT family transport system substrate-binding protein